MDSIDARSFFSDLPGARSRLKAQGLFVAEGRHLWDKLIGLGKSPVAVACVPALGDEMTKTAAGRWPVLVLPEPELGQLAGFPFHRGIMAVFPRPEPLTLNGLKGYLPESFLLAVCPRISDESNLGAIIRSAAALGAAGVVTGAGSADPYSRKALRASMGSSFTIPIFENAEAKVLGEFLKSTGCVLFGADLAESAVVLDEIQLAPKVALVLGHETDGIPSDWKQACSGFVKIPMHYGTDSLNVAVSAGILMYEMLRKQGLPSPMIKV